MEKKKRTKLKDRTLPDYTRGEEIFNMVSHIVGGALAIAALVLCVIFSALKGDPWAVVASAVYGGTMVALYAMSSIYHGLTAERAKKGVSGHCRYLYCDHAGWHPCQSSGYRFCDLWYRVGVLSWRGDIYRN